MTRENWNLSRSLLKVLRRIEKHVVAAEEKGIKLVAIEAEKFELILVLFQIHGIEKSDNAIAWLCDPVFSFLEAATSDTRTCLKQIDARLIQLRAERAAQGIEGQAVAT